MALQIPPEYSQFFAHPQKEPEIPLGIYRHYKGGIYLVTGTSQHTETLEVLVQYEGETGKWSRSLSQFTEEVNGVSRFSLLLSIRF